MISSHNYMRFRPFIALGEIHRFNQELDKYKADIEIATLKEVEKLIEKHLVQNKEWDSACGNADIEQFAIDFIKLKEVEK